MLDLTSVPLLIYVAPVARTWVAVHEIFHRAAVDRAVASVTGDGVAAYDHPAAAAAGRDDAAVAAADEGDVALADTDSSLVEAGPAPAG